MTETRSERQARSKRVIEEHGLELVRRYEAGESLPTLAREYDLYVGTLANVVRRLGGNIRTHNPQLKESRATVAKYRDEIVRRYLSGEDGGTIARELGLAHATVVRLVRDAGGVVRKPGPTVRLYGAENSAFKGGTHIKDGYRVVLVPPDHPMRTPGSKGYVLEHRLVMSQIIKRPLEPHETVHHINGDRLDNRPENLQLRSGRHGTGVHYRCRDCGGQNVEAVGL